MTLLLLLALAQTQSVPSAAQQAVPAIEWVALPPELPQSLRDSVRFGYLDVPQDHANPDGPRIRIALVLVPARSARKQPDPVVSIAGGPGLPAIRLHMSIRAAGPHPFDAYREQRDLIIIDARGHGFSEPETCRELHGAAPTTEPAEPAEQAWLARLRACRERMQTEGVRLETLSAVQTAHDLEVLRRALGAPQLNLVGISYGSRIAAEAVRQVPDAIRAVYFSGPVPPARFGDVDRVTIAQEVLGVLFRRCATHPECNAAYPNLEADYDSVRARLRRAPVRIPVPRSVAPEGVVTVTEELVQEGFAQMLLNRQLAAGAPLLIHTAAEHGIARLGGMAAQLTQAIGDDGVAPGTFLAFHCNDGVVNRRSLELLQQRCRTFLGDAWGGGRPEPLRSDVPALIETGELDPRTPPSYAHFLAAGLPRAQVVILPWYGHERPPDCSSRISRAFFDAPNTALDTSCADSIPPIRLVSGIVPSAWVGNAVGRTAGRPWLAALPAAAAVLLLASIIGIPLRARRRGEPRGGAASISLIVVAGVGLVLVLGLAAAIGTSMRRHFLIPLIGLPQGWSWLLALPWLLLLALVAAAWFAVRGALRDTAGPPATLRWMTLLGGVLLLAFWAINLR